jgi:penicillin-binding protein 2
MRHMQVNEADKFRMLAEENRINIRLVPPERGMIFDRNGVLIAGNEQNYSIVVVREDAGDIQETIDSLTRLVAIDPDDLARSVKELERRSPFVPVTIADRLSWEEFSRVAVNAPALPGVTPEVGLSRFYPLEADFAHVVGYVGPVSDFDLSKITDLDPLLQIPKFQIGKINVESRLEDDLRGRAGTREIEVNAAGRIMRELGRVEGTPGTDLQLTIDAGLQNFSQARMAGESAAAVVMDTQTGDVLALASAPSFDPNLFVRGISVADYTKLTEDEYRPLANKTVQGIYPPGSTFKMITALAALEAGLVEIDEEIFCGGYKELGNRRFHCWRRGGHGKVDLVEAIYQSCDVYFYDIAERVGIEAISEVARKLGMNHRHELPLSGIAEGLAPTKDWKRARRGEDWLVGDTLNSGIGQGFVLASPLQLAVMTARLASGRAVEPRLLKSVNGVETPLNAGAPLPFKASNLAAIREGMDRVSNFQRGTAFRSRIVADGMAMAGKTGTSQVRNITAEERAAGVTQNADLPWNRRDHALFVAYAPVDNPRFACSVIVEHGGGGSTAAAPIARDIMLYAQFGAVPPLSAYPAGQHNEISDRFDALQLRRFERETTVRART